MVHHGQETPEWQIRLCMLAGLKHNRGFLGTGDTIPLPSDPLGTAAFLLRSSEHTARERRFRPGVASPVNAGFEECFRRNLASEWSPARTQTDVGA